MAWSPKLAKVEPHGNPSQTRPWVAVAEEHASDAVNLLISIMNGPHPTKIRMEAAVRVLQIAGATFRGEKKDAQGRPAANLNGKGGGRVLQMSKEALSTALRQLPEPAVVRSPDEMDPEKEYVVFHDGEHLRKPIGCNPVNPVGGVVKLKEEDNDNGS